MRQNRCTYLPPQYGSCTQKETLAVRAGRAVPDRRHRFVVAVQPASGGGGFGAVVVGHVCGEGEGFGLGRRVFWRPAMAGTCAPPRRRRAGAGKKSGVLPVSSSPASPSRRRSSLSPRASVGGGVAGCGLRAVGRGATAVGDGETPARWRAPCSRCRSVPFVPLVTSYRSASSSRISSAVMTTVALRGGGDGEPAARPRRGAGSGGDARGVTPAASEPVRASERRAVSAALLPPVGRPRSCSSARSSSFVICPIGCWGVGRARRGHVSAAWRFSHPRREKVRRLGKSMAAGGGIVPVLCADKASEEAMAPPQPQWASMPRCVKAVIVGPRIRCVVSA
eukprot:COSAG04_NODE_1749_length_5711_cov_7.754052_6_plen_337_part_00